MVFPSISKVTESLVGNLYCLNSSPFMSHLWWTSSSSLEYSCNSLSRSTNLSWEVLRRAVENFTLSIFLNCIGES